VRAYPAQCAALVSVELCSLTWQRDDLSAANLRSSLSQTPAAADGGLDKSACLDDGE
jgi:predicted naringenin-chalcone synthase